MSGKLVMVAKLAQRIGRLLIKAVKAAHRWHTLRHESRYQRMKRERQEAMAEVTPEYRLRYAEHEERYETMKETRLGLHLMHFPEEYDWILDGPQTRQWRLEGRAVIPDEELAVINERRHRMGVSLMPATGLVSDKDSWSLCHEAAMQMCGLAAE